jgi:hypothetical protein
MSPLSFASHPSSRARARALHRPLLSFLSLVSAPADWTAAAMLSSCRHTIVAPPWWALPCPWCPPLLDHASPPPSPPPATGLVDALPGHWSSATALERHRVGSFPPPHHRQPSLVRTPLPHHARCNRRRSPVDSPLGTLHLGRWRSRVSHATAPLVWPGWAIVPLGQANSDGPRAKMLTQHCVAFFGFSIFI